MATVDDKVVAASFESSKFESGVHRTIAALEKLKNALKFPEAGKGLNQINTASQKVDFSHIGNALDGISSKLGALRLAGIAVMASLANQAISAGSRMIKAFTFQPVIDGLHEYENQLNSVQTILANTQSAGTNLKDVNGALNQLNQYADKTIYNFGQMTKNIGTFTAAGVDLETSVKSIKGISNLAALSGSNAEQASTAMYQLSQAISSGRVSLQDWNSVVNAGMGGTVFQRALAQTAESMGTLSKGSVELKGKMKNVSIEGQSFRESIQARPGEKSWLTSEVLTNTLKQFSGDLSKAELKAQGFNDAQIKAIRAQAKTALAAATEVKTFSQLVDTTKEAIGSGWASTFQLIFGDFKEAKTLFTGLSNVIGGFVKTSAKSRNKMLKDWKAAGGRTTLIEAFKQAFEDLAKIIGPISKAFRDIFPKTTGGQLASMTRSLLRFTQALEPSKETMENLRRTFRGFFAVLDIGKMIVSGIFSVIAKLFGAAGEGSGGFLELTGSIGDFLVSVDVALRKGGQLHKFFDTLGDILSTPVHLLGLLGDAIGSAFSGESIGKASAALSPLEKIIEGIVVAWDKFLGSVGSTREVVRPALEGLAEMFGAIGQTIADALKGANFDAIFKVLEVGLLAGIFLTLKKTLSGGLGNALAGGVLQSVVQAFTGVGGLSRSIGGTFNALTGSITTLQQNVKSDTLKNIAISIALLSASIIGLSLVDPEKLNSALAAITIGFGQLLGAMAIMDKIGKSGGFIKMPVIAASMVVLATAINLLSIAVFTMSRLSWEELAKGLGAVAVLLGGISAASGPLTANAVGMIRAATGITVIAVAMNLLALAVKQMGSLDTETLAKGLGGVVVALAGIGAASRLFPGNMIAIGLGLIAIGFGMKLLVGTIAKLGSLDMKTLAKGIGAVAVTIAAIGLAMQAMPPTMILTAAGLILVGVALQSITKAIGTLGGMSMTELAKGIGALAAALLVLSVGLIAMSGSLAGAAALGVAAAGIAILAPALKTLGEQSWGQIIKGLVALGAAFVLLGIAGVVLAPVAPAILALGVALIAVGAGLALAGAGIALIGIGLAAIAVAGPAAIKILVDALVALTVAGPKLVEGLIKAFVTLVEGISRAAPKLVKAVTEIINLVLTAVIAAAPKLAIALIALIDAVLKVLVAEAPKLVQAGFILLKAFLRGLIQHIESITSMVATIISKFLGAVGKNLGKIVGGGVAIVTGLLKGIANNIGKVVTAGASIIVNLLRGVGNNVAKIVRAAADIIVKIVGALGRGAARVVSAGASLILNFLQGIANKGPAIVSAAVTAVSKFIHAVSRGAVKMADEGATAIINFLNGIAKVIRTREPEMIRAGFNIGKAVVQGMLNGLGSLAQQVKDKAKNIADSALKSLGKTFHLGSPSKVTYQIGVWVVEGLANGIDSNAKAIESANNLGKAIVANLDKSVKAKSPTIRALGKYVGENFYAGLLGVVKDSGQVMTAFDALAEQLTGNISDLNSKIDDARQARNEARENHNAKAARRHAQALKRYQAELKLVTAADKELNKALVKDRDDLRKLTKEFEDISTQLDEAQQHLADLQAEKKSFVDSTFDQFAELPGFGVVDADGNPVDPKKQVENYIGALGTAAGATAAFTTTTDQLKAAGLNEETYRQLLDAGPAAQGFADSLLSMGPDAIAAVNKAETDLRGAAKTLADHAGSALYDNMLYVGSQSAQGIVDSLQQRKTDIYAAMEEIAEGMIKAIKKKLKIKSPSKAFAKIGVLSTEGLAKGLVDSSKLVTDAAATVGEDALSAIKTSMSGLSDMVNAEINTDPVITPVLDLSQLRKDASAIGNVIPITAAASFGQASSISADQAGQAAAGTQDGGSIIKFEQNNYSPESLSPIQIYRQTKNQLSQAKPVLAK